MMFRGRRRQAFILCRQSPWIRLGLGTGLGRGTLRCACALLVTRCSLAYFNFKFCTRLLMALPVLGPILCAKLFCSPAGSDETVFEDQSSMQPDILHAWVYVTCLHRSRGFMYACSLSSQHSVCALLKAAVKFVTVTVRLAI